MGQKRYDNGFVLVFLFFFFPSLRVADRLDVPSFHTLQVRKMSSACLLHVVAFRSGRYAGGFGTVRPKARKRAIYMPAGCCYHNIVKPLFLVEQCVLCQVSVIIERGGTGSMAPQDTPPSLC
jgi:hypothetical protein